MRAMMCLGRETASTSTPSNKPREQHQHGPDQHDYPDELAFGSNCNRNQSTQNGDIDRPF